MQLELGQIIKDRYKLTESIREGGFTTVFRADDLELNREVAVKFMKPNAFVSENSFVRFQHEATQMMQLPHKNLLAIYSVDLSGTDLPMLVTEYLPWRSLGELLADKKGLSYEDCKDIFAQICAGLSFAHGNGIIHRDLSPSHIVLSEGQSDRIVKIIDFGVSRQLRENTGRAITITQLSKTGKLIGNPGFMSPESIMGEKADRVSDIYSLGCVLYNILCGRPPFEAKSPVDLIVKHQKEIPQEPLFDWQDQNKEAAKYKFIALRCLQKDRNKRFQSVDEIIACLNAERDGWGTAGGVCGWKKGEEKASESTGAKVELSQTQVLKSPVFLLSLVLVFVLGGLFVFLNHHNAVEQSEKLEGSAKDGDGAGNSLGNLEQQWAAELSRQEKVFGVRHPRTFNMVLRMAQLYESEGKIQEAKVCFKKALAIKEEEFGRKSAESIPVMQALADLYKLEGSYAEASELLGKVLDSGAGNQLWALEGLAECSLNRGKIEEAISFYTKAINLAEHSASGKENLELAQNLIGLSVCLNEKGLKSDGEKNYKRALEILEKCPDSKAMLANLSKVLEKHAELLRSSGKLGPAKELETKIQNLGSTAAVVK